MEYNYNSYEPQTYREPSISLGQYAARTFGWMFAGLLLTFVVAFSMVVSGRYVYLYSGSLYLILAIAEVVVVLVLSARIHKLSINNARALFFLYSVLNGVTMCGILLAYSVGSLIYVFGMTSLYFGVMAVYGMVTKSDLSRVRPILITGLIVLVVWLLLSTLLGIGANSRLMCVVGAAVFIGFTAYDTQKIRANYAYYAQNDELLEKASIISALQLYLDFINLFLYLLRLFGKRK